MTSALFDDIYRAFPGREIHLNAHPPWHRLFIHDPRFSTIISIDLRGKERGIKGTWRWLQTIAAHRYDLVIDLQSTDRSRILLTLLWLIGRPIRYRIGNIPQWPYNFHPPSLPRSTHPFERMRTALRSAGIATTSERPVLHVPQHNRERARELMTAHGLQQGRYALLLPGSQAAGWLKRWGAERYSALAHALHAQGVTHVVLAGGSDEREECERIASGCGEWLVNLCGQTEIFDLVPIAAGAVVIVANDTGTAHVASATPTPMWVICGPTDPRRVRPIGSNVTALQADLPCINCYGKTCANTDFHACMKAITPEYVVELTQRASTVRAASTPATTTSVKLFC